MNKDKAIQVAINLLKLSINPSLYKSDRDELIKNAIQILESTQQTLPQSLVNGTSLYSLSGTTMT